MARIRFEQLYERLTTEPFRRKILICRSYAEGNIVLERLSRQAGPLFNVEVSTLDSLAVKHAQIALFERGISLIRPQQSFWVIQAFMTALAEKQNAYLTKEHMTPSIVKRVHHTVMELRNALIQPVDLHLDQFPHTSKGQYIQELLTRYEQYLSSSNLVDLPGLMPFIEPEQNDTMYITIPGTAQRRAEKDLLQKVTGGRMNEGGRWIELESGPSFVDEASGFPAKEASFFRATGTLAEVREVFRRIVSNELPLDEVELIAPDYETYSVAVHSIASAFGLGCTYAKGLPIESTTVGMAAIQLLKWIEEGFHDQTLLHMLRRKQITLFSGEEQMSHAESIRYLEQARIGWGKERYVMRLDPNLFSQEKHEAVRSLQQLFQQWLDTLPAEDDWHPITLFRWLTDRLTKHAVVRTEEDSIVLETLKERAADCEAYVHFGLPSEEQLDDESLADDCLDSAGAGRSTVNTDQSRSAKQGMTKSEAIPYVRMMFDSIRAHVGARPQPGKLHLSSLSDGGLSGRNYTFLLGMNANAWSVSERQDPILLDDERARISPELPRSEQLARLRKSEQMSRLGLIRGSVTCSYSSFDTAQNKSVSPAYEMLQLYRQAADDPNADFQTMLRQIGVPIGYVSDSSGDERMLDATDAVMKQLQGKRDGQMAAIDAITAVFPSTGAGWHARNAREVQLILTDYDGLISEQHEQLSDLLRKRPYVSASQLETYAACPLRYYFQYVLNIRKKEQAEWDRARWLTPLDRGSLLHRIFYLYGQEMRSARESDDGAESNLQSGAADTEVHVKAAEARLDDQQVHERKRLTEITDAVLTEYKQLVPSPSDAIYEKECEEIRRDLEVFYELERDNVHTPVFFEQELSIDGEPITVDFGENLRLRIKGFVDRIDQIGEHEYRMIDYKTGSSNSYREQGFFAGGTQLQHAIYAVAAESWLQQTGIDPRARVREAVYLFPTERGGGKQVLRIENRKEELRQLLQNMLQAIESGIFIPTKDANMCRCCDYKDGCESHAEYMKEKREQPLNHYMLEPLLEVERVD